MTLNLKNTSPADIRATIRTKRAEIAEQNIKILKEIGISPDGLASEINAEMSRLLSTINYGGKPVERFNRFLKYEERLQILLDRIQYGFHTSIEIQTEFIELKNEFQAEFSDAKV